MTRFVRVRMDDPRLPSLQHACLPHDQPRDFSKDAVWVGLDEADNDIAFCSVRDLGNGSHYLSRAGVVPEARGKGLQKRMIRLRVAHARRHGARYVITDCTSENMPSANSLMACGFRLYEPARAWALPNSLYWRLRC